MVAVLNPVLGNATVASKVDAVQELRYVSQLRATDRPGSLLRTIVAGSLLTAVLGMIHGGLWFGLMQFLIPRIKETGVISLFLPPCVIFLTGFFWGHLIARISRWTGMLSTASRTAAVTFTSLVGLYWSYLVWGALLSERSFGNLIWPPSLLSVLQALLATGVPNLLHQNTGEGHVVFWLGELFIIISGSYFGLSGRMDRELPCLHCGAECVRLALFPLEKGSREEVLEGLRKNRLLGLKIAAKPQNPELDNQPLAAIHGCENCHGTARLVVYRWERRTVSGKDLFLLKEWVEPIELYRQETTQFLERIRAEWSTD